MLQSLFPEAMRTEPVGTLYCWEMSWHCVVMFPYALNPESNCRCFNFAAVTTWPVHVRAATDVELEVAVVETAVVVVYEV